VFANVATPTCRYILAYQRRNLSDALFQPVIDFAARANGSFWFALHATSPSAPEDVEGEVQGCIYLFKSKDDWRNGPEQVFRSKIRTLNEARLSLTSDRNDVTRSEYEAAGNAVQRGADVTVDFLMHRSGEVYFSVPRFRDENLAYASRDFARQWGHDFDKWITDQTYFFFRDLTHQHQHHIPAVDTILILQKRDANDDFAWRRNIVFSLQYHVISARRTRDVYSLVQALGVIAYCKSFLGVCRNTAGDSSAQIPTFQIEALEQSIEAKIKEAELHLEDDRAKDNRVTNTRVLMVAIVAPVLALLGVFVQPR
jgi:hypothetical protein